MKVIAITGGISSGKSLTRCLLEKHGAVSIGVDGLCRVLMDSNSELSCFNDIVKTFGTSILTSTNTIDKCKLGKLLFATNGFMKLQKIFSANLIKILEIKLNLLKEQGYQFVFVETPLLYVKVLRHLFDEVIMISTSKQAERLMNDEHITHSEANKIIKALGTTEEYLEVATKVVNNDGTREDLLNELIKLLEQVGIILDVYQPPQS
jgi:dephospho-CoA kinase